MRIWSKLCPILSVATSLSLAIPAQATTCEGERLNTKIDNAVTKSAEAARIYPTKEERDLALKQGAELDALDAKIEKIRRKNGTWEPNDLTEKRMNVITFETLLMLNDLKSINNMFGGNFDIAQRAAVRILTAEAIIKSYNEQMAKDSSRAGELQAKIADEQRLLDDAKAVFLEKMETSSSLMYVMDVMIQQGLIVDATTLFGTSDKLLDINGSEIKKQGIALMAPPSSVTPGGQKPAVQPEVKANTDEITEPVAMAEAVQMPTIQTPKDNAEVPVEVRDVQIKEVQSRAQKLDKTLGVYFKTDAIQTLISYAKGIVGENFTLERPTYTQLEELRKRLGPDWNSAAQQIKYRKDLLFKERMLRLKLLTLGPQAAQLLTNYVGSVGDSKLKSILRPIARLGGLEYDAGIRRKHLGNILKVLAIKNTKDQIQAMRNFNGATSYNDIGEFVVSFIRFPPAQDDWNKILTYLADSKQPYDKELLDLFKSYQEEAKQRGDLVLYGQSRDIVGSVVSSAVLGSYVYGGGWIIAHGGNWLAHTGASVGAWALSSGMDAAQHVLNIIPHLHGG